MATSGAAAKKNGNDPLQVVVERKVCSLDGAEGTWKNDHVATEYPLTLFVNDQEMATIVCTPTDLEELAIGFLRSEGVLSSYNDVDNLFIDVEEGTIHIEAPAAGTLEQEMFAKRYVGSCCGKSRTGFYFYNDARTASKVEAGWTLDVDSCFQLIDALHASSDAFALTGGVHNAGLAHWGKALEVTRTDIGRHNTLDKLYGYAVKERLDLSEYAIAFSGRISSEVLLKVAKMGAPFLISKSAPTELALQMAHDLRITTLGFIRGRRGNVYTHPWRIEGLEPDQ